MKVQFETGRIRLRVSNAELTRLHAGESLDAALAWPGVTWRLDVGLGDMLEAVATPAAVVLRLPRADADALASRLPARDGLRYTVELPTGPLDLRFEVDLHDGRRPR